MNQLNLNSIKIRVATICATILGVVLFVCANTNSTFVVHQPETPHELDRFRSFK